MPSLDQPTAIKPIKGLIIGDSGSGKTGALASLVGAGYKLRIFDFDNNLGYFINRVRKDYPDKVKNVSYQTFTDKFKASQTGPIPDGTPTAFSRALMQMDRWTDDPTKPEIPAQWGLDTIGVLDSLTFCSDAAFRYAKAMNPGMGTKGGPDPRQVYFHAQENIASMLSLLCSDSFFTHFLVLAHVQYEQSDGIGLLKGFPRSIGSALNPKIPAWFNTMLVIESTGTGGNTKRLIKTAPTGLIDAKTAVILPSAEPLPLETGLATFFATAKAAAVQAKV